MCFFFTWIHASKISLCRPDRLPTHHNSFFFLLIVQWGSLCRPSFFFFPPHKHKHTVTQPLPKLHNSFCLFVSADSSKGVPSVAGFLVRMFIISNKVFCFVVNASLFRPVMPREVCDSQLSHLLDSFIYIIIQDFYKSIQVSSHTARNINQKIKHHPNIPPLPLYPTPQYVLLLAFLVRWFKRERTPMPTKHIFVTLRKHAYSNTLKILPP